MTDEKLFSPSGFDILVNCPGSWKLQKDFIREDNQYSLEGTEAHVYAAKILKMDYFEADYYSKEMKAKGWVGLMDYYNHVHDSMGLKKSLLKIENKINLPDLHKQCSGTPDAYFYDAYREYVHIFDFKYGYNIVSAENNWQLLGYATYFLNIVPMATEFKLSIIQPRAIASKSVRVSTVNFDKVLTAKNTIKAKIQESLSDNPIFKAGNHCKYCLARSKCKEFNSSADEIINYILDYRKIK